MTELISRSLREGSLEGEHAAALTIKDSLRSQFGLHTFSYFLFNLISNISFKSQACGLVLVALSKSPSFYLELLKSKGIDYHLVRILDCYSDPLGWKKQISKKENDGKDFVTTFENVKNASELLSSILELGKGFVGDGKARFAIAIDSLSVILRHVPLLSVATLISSLRSNGNGETIQIYDGRHSLSESRNDVQSTQPINYSTDVNNGTNVGAGEIHYIRDSDDEAPDSDEDPDDDLDI